MIAIPITVSQGDIVLQGLLVNAPEPEYHTTEELADYLYQYHRADIAVANFVIVRPPVDRVMSECDFQVSAYPILRQRIPSVALYLLGSENFEHFVSRNLNGAVMDALGGIETKNLLSQLRSRELEWYVDQSNALLKTSGTRYFRAPSAKYCQHFIRVGNIQTSRSAIDAIFFWLLPWLKDCSAIIAESWTISSTALNAARLLSRYAPRSHARCRVDMLSSYPDDSDVLRQKTEEVVRRVLPHKDDKVLLLVSSCMSGNLVNRFTTTLAKAGIAEERCRCGAIFSLNQDQPVPALCDATTLVPTNGFEFHERLPLGGSVIEIDRTTYFPLRIEENLGLFREGPANRFREFFDIYRTSRLFSVHRDCQDIYGQVLRHHAIDLEVGEILEVEPFRTKYIEMLGRIDAAPKCIVVPPHHTGKRMAEIAKDFFREHHNVEIPIWTHPDLVLETPLEGQEIYEGLHAVAPEECILVIDDVSVTGRRLSTYAQSLRAIGYKGQIHYRIGIARPANSLHWKTVRNQLRHRRDGARHTVEEVHLVVLPDWNEDFCPWCAELDQYRRSVVKGVELSADIASRMKLLANDEFSDTMTESLFLNGPGEAPLDLAQGSIFIRDGATQAALFSAVASLLQSMRSSEVEPYMPSPNYPEVTVIDPDNYLGTRFPESSIRAAIIRAALPRELSRARDSDERDRAIKAREVIFGGPQGQNLSLELLLAGLIGKLPAFRLSDEEKTALQARYPDQASFLIGS